MTALGSTTFQVGLAINTDSISFQQVGNLALDYDLLGEVSGAVRYLLPLVFLYLAAAACFLDSGIRWLVGLFSGGGWLADLRLVWYAATNNRSSYYGLGVA